MCIRDRPSKARPWLTPLAPLYRLGLALEELQLRTGLKPVRRLRWPVVSIGNLSTGGAGKTPLTIALAQALVRRGLRVDVLSRGYGRRSALPLPVEPRGTAEEFGDEPLLIAREAGVPVYVADERYQAGLLAENSEQLPGGLHLLDDGFQPVSYTHLDVYKRQFWLRPGIAYLHILSFGDYTGREVEQNLKRLGEDRIEGLILDLRDNGGGLLNQAVDVAGHFLEKGQSVVSQRGRSSRERVYTAEHATPGRRYPIVVLVNHYSASAAEIVSGALQDHDRAWILGENTFGKGLVQTIFQLPGRTALALTTAHFYTPSGRLIQRDYSHESLYDYYFHEGRATPDTNDRRTTDGGRTVFGGNGIAPDEKYAPPRSDRLEAALDRVGLFGFTRAYFAAHPAKLPEGWMPGNDLVEELHDYLLDHGYQFTEAEFTRDHDWIKRYLTREMYIWAFDVDESDRVFAMTDPEAVEAMDALAQAAALLEKGRVVVESRRPAPAPDGQR